MNLEISKRLVIIPTYNEAGSVEQVISDIRDHYRDLPILIVDANSPDSTIDIVTSIKEHDKNLELFIEQKKSSLSKAYKLGIKWGLENNFENFIQFDADGTHSASDLKEFLGTRGDYYISGVRNSDNPQTPIRKFITFAARTLINTIFGYNLKDPTSGLNAFSAEFLKKFDVNELTESGYFIQIQLKILAKRYNSNFIETPIYFGKRINGKSKVRIKIMFETFKALLEFYKAERK